MVKLTNCNSANDWLITLYHVSNVEIADDGQAEKKNPLKAK